MQTESIIKLIGRRPVYRVATDYPLLPFPTEFGQATRTLPRKNIWRGQDMEACRNTGVDCLANGVELAA